MAIYKFIVDFPIKHGDFPWLFVSSPEGRGSQKSLDDKKPWENPAKKPISRAPASPSCAALDSSHQKACGAVGKKHKSKDPTENGWKTKHEILRDVF